MKIVGLIILFVASLISKNQSQIFTEELVIQNKTIKLSDTLSCIKKSKNLIISGHDLDTPNKYL